MSSAVADPQVAASLDELGAAVHQLGQLDVDPVDIVDAHAYVRQLEAIGRQVKARQVEVVNILLRSGVHKVDGHASPKVMVRHAANLSPAEAQRRDAAARVLRRMPLVAAAFANGDIGPCQVDRIAKTHSNPRVRDAFEAQDANVAVLAHRLPYKDFDDKLADWERLEDEDGARDQSERNHRNRRHRIHTDLDGSRRIDASWGALEGAEVQAIHDHFRELEFQADWAEARGLFGDAATVADLRRTEDQRSADAALAAWRAGSGAHAAQTGGAGVVTNIVIDHETFDREVRHLCGDDPGPDPRADAFLLDAVGEVLDGDDPAPGSPSPQEQASGRRPAYRCSTDDGIPVHPGEAVAAALLGHVRRVVIGADGVVLDMGRLRRLFTGPQRDAVMLSGRRCTWVGCLVPGRECQADHLESFNGPGQGRTSPDNGAPLCGRHNRLKEQGFALYRDERGRIHLLRPDGTEIT